MGMLLNNEGLWKGSELVANTERGIRKALGLKYKEPTLR